MKTAVVCVSTHHGNRRRVAQAMADVLGAAVFTVDEAATLDGRAYDLTGFGSGVYFGRHHASLRHLVCEMPSLPHRAVVFSTAGIASLAPIWHKSLIRLLRHRGGEVIEAVKSSASFAARVGTPLARSDCLAVYIRGGPTRMTYVALGGSLERCSIKLLQ
jgi:flavodoxin